MYTKVWNTFFIIESTDSLDHVDHGTSQRKEELEINNNNRKEENSELLDEQTPHQNNTNLAFETKSSSPHESCVDVTTGNPKELKTAVNDLKKKKSSKTTSKTCCLL